MKDLGITKGEIVINDELSFARDLQIKGREEDDIYMPLLDRHCVSEKEMIANANLFVDAHNTAQKCGLLPSELLKQRDELKEALKEMSELFEKLHGSAIVGKTIRQKALAAIKSTEQ